MHKNNSNSPYKNVPFYTSTPFQSPSPEKVKENGARSPSTFQKAKSPRASTTRSKKSASDRRGKRLTACENHQPVTDPPENTTTRRAKDEKPVLPLSRANRAHIQIHT